MAISDSPPRYRVTRHLLVAVALLALAALVWTVVDALLIGFGGIVFATVLLALARPLSRMTGLGPRWSLAIVIAALLVVGIVLGWLFGNEVANQFAELQRRLPEAVAKLRVWLEGSSAGRTVVASARDTVANAELLSQAGLIATGIVAAAGNLLLIVFLGIYFASDPALYRDGAVRLVPPAHRARVGEALDASGVALQKWLVAQAIAMVAVGVLTGTALALVGVPLALSLGVLAGLFDFIPVVGPILAAVPGILLAFTEGPQMALYAALVYLGVQQLEGNVITPLVQRWAVRLPPVLGLLAIVACGILFGALGVIFAMPLAVVTMVLVKKLYVDELERRAKRGGKAKSAAADGAG